MEAIIDQYTREAGVRNLDRTLAAVIRGTAATIAEQMDETARQPAPSPAPPPTNGQPAPEAGAPAEPGPAALEAIKNQKSKIKNPPANGQCITIHPSDLQKLLGPSRFESELAQRTATAGVVTGLAYTPVGGEILFIEATQMPGKGILQLTGQIGDIMKESAQAAFSLLKHNAQKLGIDPELFAKIDVHIHVPQGAIPKDGPSAGIAMYTALASLFLDKPVRPDLAMTGEITLRGLVLPIGGVKEKAIAAERAGIKTVILPQRNEKNLSEIHGDVRQRLRFHFANTVDEVLALALAGAPKKVRKNHKRTVV